MLGVAVYRRLAVIVACVAADTVNKTLEEMGMKLELPTMPGPFSLDLTPQFAATGSTGPRCEILCNGRPAWFKGAFPCLGKLTVECEAGQDAPKFAPDFVAASCKGFWSGILGHRVCASLTPAHDLRYDVGHGYLQVSTSNNTARDGDASRLTSAWHLPQQMFSEHGSGNHSRISFCVTCLVL